MTKPLTPKQEKFAQKYLELGNAYQAYVDVYSTDNMADNSIRIEASRLLDHPNISQTIQALRDKHTERHCVTIDTLTAEYNEAKQKAYELEQVSSAVSAINGKAKIHGFDKQVIDSNAKITVKVVDLSGKPKT
jgi:phage terminase small subunit